MRVLLVEDDTATSKSIELMLKSEGFVCDTTDLGEDGLEIGKIYDYDIIILDLMLPDIDGYEVLRRLRAARVKTPILILSGLAELDNKLKGLGFGADDYLTKPFDKRELIARIHAIVRRAKGHSQSIIKTGKLTVNLDTRTVGGERPAPPPHRQGIRHPRAAEPAQGHDAHQGDVPQPSLRRHRRAGAEDHRRVRLQAAQEAGDRPAPATTTSRRCGAAATCCAIPPRPRAAAPSAKRRRAPERTLQGGAGKAPPLSSRLPAARRKTRRRFLFRPQATVLPSANSPRSKFICAKWCR